MCTISSLNFQNILVSHKIPQIGRTTASFHITWSSPPCLITLHMCFIFSPNTQHILVSQKIPPSWQLNPSITEVGTHFHSLHMHSHVRAHACSCPETPPLVWATCMWMCSSQGGGRRGCHIIPLLRGTRQNSRGGKDTCSLPRVVKYPGSLSFSGTLLYCQCLQSEWNLSSMQICAFTTTNSTTKKASEVSR